MTASLKKKRFFEADAYILAVYHNQLKISKTSKFWALIKIIENCQFSEANVYHIFERKENECREWIRQIDEWDVDL